MSQKDKQELLASLNWFRGIALSQCREWRKGHRGNAVTARKSLVTIRKAKREERLV